ncbi:hypothetical protein Tco_1085072, partial [Tanacetum coccineum]
TNSIVELADHNIWSAINEFCHALSLRRVKLRHNVHEAEYLKVSMRNGLEIGLSVGGKLFRLSMLRIRNSMKQYHELLVDICEVFVLGSFEPLKNAIGGDQDLWKKGKIEECMRLSTMSDGC